MPAKVSPCYSRTIVIPACDTDQSGFAELAAYIRWMEETEYAFLRSLGLSVTMSDERGRFGFPRLGSAVRVFQPLQMGDTIRIDIRLGSYDLKRLQYEFSIFRTREPQTTVAEGAFEVACCRFPGDRLPYAILVPDIFLEKLPTPDA